MFKKNLKILSCLIVMLALATVCFAADNKIVAVTASIPQQNGLTVTVSKVVGTTWTAATSVAFGNLTFDSTNNIFVANGYYAVDVGINSNVENWTVTHKTMPIANGASNLDNNVNVTFMKQVDNNNGTELAKLSYANSNNKGFTKNQLAGAWLRVYYGIATGEAGKDAPGAVPVDANKSAGAYQGSVTFTLTP